jgi:hypothetical protein
MNSFSKVCVVTYHAIVTNHYQFLALKVFRNMADKLTQ